MVDGLGVRAPWLMGTPEQSTFPPAVTVTTVYSNNKINKTNKGAKIAIMSYQYADQSKY